MSERLSGIRAVIFDFDDTLVATIKPKWEEHKLVAKLYYKKVLLDEELRLHWGKPFSQFVQLIYGTEDVVKAVENIGKHRDDFPKILFEGSIPTLKKLKKKGFLTGIITATTQRNIGMDLQMLGFPPKCIDYLQTEDDTNFHKPDPRVFEPAIKWLSDRRINPSQVVYIADGLHDMKAARGVGFHFIGVETGLVSASEFADHGAISVSNVGGVLELIS